MAVAVAVAVAVEVAAVAAAAVVVVLGVVRHWETRGEDVVQVQHRHGRPYCGRLGFGELPWVLAPRLRRFFRVFSPFH